MDIHVTGSFGNSGRLTFTVYNATLTSNGTFFALLYKKERLQPHYGYPIQILKVVVVIKGIITSISSRTEPTIETMKMNQSTTKVNQPTTKVHQPATKVNQPTTKVHQPTTKVNQPTTKVHQTPTKVNQPTTKVNQPTTKVNRATTKVNQPTTKVNRPTTKVNQPTTKVHRRTTEAKQAKTNESTTIVIGFSHGIGWWLVLLLSCLIFSVVFFTVVLFIHYTGNPRISTWYMHLCNVGKY
ncbi:uncharacterized protein LOC114521177 [Dendronephthya gigantea]|nr:uncharacterized protein LOC114521177 [Dendronephthya gigantea]